MPFLRSKTFLLGLFFLLGAAPTGAQPWNPVPDAVAGQIDLVRTHPNFIDGRGLWRPQEVAVDTSVVPNRAYVYDVLNNRVLGWRNVAALANGAPADLVLGQPDVFTVGCNTGGISRGSLCPDSQGLFWTGLAVDPGGNVYVGDTGNNRILEFDSPFTSDTLADRVFVAQDFTSKGCRPNASGQIPLDVPCNTSGLAFDRDGNLYVADAVAGVFIYRQPLTTDTVPDGQVGRRECLSPDASSFCGAKGLALDAAGNLYVADIFLNRVLVFRSPLTAGGVADLVLGQPDFTTQTQCSGADTTPLPADRLCFPSSVAVDEAGNVWVADQSHHRVLGYDSPLTSDAVPDRVLGKRGSFTSGVSSCNGVLPARDLFCFPTSVALGSQGALWVAESSHNRVLRFSMPLTARALPDLVLGQVDFIHDQENLVDGLGFSSPQGIVVDHASSPAHVYVADTENNRVLGWRDARDLAARRPADLVLGQPDLFSNKCNTGGPSARSLCSPNGLAVDAAGNLYVADTENNRILAFDSPFTADTVADQVFGQGGSFTSKECNNAGISAGSLCSPFGVAVDRQGNLYVADTTNQRVLLYNQPRRKDTVADQVFGQRGSFRRGRGEACRGGRDFLCLPLDVAVDAAGNLYVADTGNRRVLEYDRPVRSDVQPDRVFGQKGSFATRRCGLGRDSLCSPARIELDASGALYVVEGGHLVVVRYPEPLRQARIDLTFRGFMVPTAVAADSAGNLYVTDGDGNRVLVFDNP